MRFVSLFTGIGGIDLGLERAGWECVMQVENDPWCQLVLEKHWPGVLRRGDVRRVHSAQLPTCDAIVGGFPCQDISTANSGTARAALAGERSGLWYEMERLISGYLPQWVLVENVATNWRSWLPKVRDDLHAMGYFTTALGFAAAAVGAPHLRQRIFVIGYADGDGEPISTINAEASGVSAFTGLGGYWRDTAPGALRMDDGVPFGVDRLRGLGNAVVPQVAEWVGRIINQAEDQ